MMELWFLHLSLAVRLWEPEQITDLQGDEKVNKINNRLNKQSNCKACKTKML